MIRVLEVSWIVIAIIALCVGIYETWTHSFNDGLIFFVFTFVAGFMFILRRRQRLRLEKEGKK